MKLEVGSKVRIKHQLSQGEYIVSNPSDKLETPITLPDGKIISEYVRIGNNKESNLGYHLESLEEV